jgi:hypothetical protein
VEGSAVFPFSNESWAPHCPDFLCRPVALIHSMRLSLRKGAPASLSSTAWQEIVVKPGSGLSGIPQSFLVILCDATERPLFEAMQFCRNAFCCPCNTQSMQHEFISRTQLTGISDGLKCVINVAALCDTPGFVANDSVTVDAG